MLNDREFNIELEDYRALLNGFILINVAVIGAILFTDKVEDVTTGLGFLVAVFIFVIAASIRIRKRMKES
ncbi:MAG: hypothetical protein J4445_01020 [DPANN group archaeon]|nr:hypothetical protein [DPANN group archaeon]